MTDNNQHSSLTPALPSTEHYCVSTWASLSNPACLLLSSRSTTSGMLSKALWDISELCQELEFHFTSNTVFLCSSGVLLDETCLMKTYRDWDDNMIVKMMCVEACSGRVLIANAESERTTGGTWFSGNNSSQFQSVGGCYSENGSLLNWFVLFMCCQG